jgi:hypothetical protein
MDKRFYRLDDEELDKDAVLAELRAKHRDAKPDDYLLDATTGQFVPAPGSIGSGLASAAANVLPGLGALVGGTAGLAAGGPLGAAGGGLGGGYLVGKAQDAVLPDAAKDYLARAAAAHPALTTATGIGTGLVASGGGGLGSKIPMLARLGSAGLNAGLDAGVQMAQNQSIDPRNINLLQTGLAGAAGGLLPGRAPGMLGRLQANTVTPLENAVARLPGLANSPHAQEILKRNALPPEHNPYILPPRDPNLPPDKLDRPRNAAANAVLIQNQHDIPGAIKILQEQQHPITPEELEYLGPNVRGYTAKDQIPIQELSTRPMEIASVMKGVGHPEGAKAILEARKAMGGAELPIEEAQRLYNKPEALQSYLSANATKIAERIAQQKAAEKAAEEIPAQQVAESLHDVKTSEPHLEQLAKQGNKTAALMLKAKRAGLDLAPEDIAKLHIDGKQHLDNLLAARTDEQINAADKALAANRATEEATAKAATEKAQTKGVSEEMKKTEAELAALKVAKEREDKLQQPPRVQATGGPIDDTLSYAIAKGNPKALEELGLLNHPTIKDVMELRKLGVNVRPEDVRAIQREPMAAKNAILLRHLQEAAGGTMGHGPTVDVPPGGSGSPTGGPELPPPTLPGLPAPPTQKKTEALAVRPSAPEQKIPGMGANLRKKPSSTEGGFVAMPEPLRRLGEGLNKAITSSADLIREVRPKIAAALSDMPVVFTQLHNEYARHVDTAFKGLKRAEIEHLGDLMHQEYSTQTSLRSLLPDKLLPAYDSLRAMYRTMQVHQNLEGPLIEGRRKAEQSDFWVPGKFSSEARDLLQSNSPRGQEIKDAWTRDYTSRNPGATPEEALAALKQRAGIGIRKGDPIAEYGPLRRSEGVPLPKELRAGFEESARTYVTRWARDMAFHQTIESRPEIAIPLGLKDSGKGVDYTKGEFHDPETGERLTQDMRLDAPFKDVMNNYNNIGADHTGGFRAASSLAKSVIMGPHTALAFLAQTPTSMYPLMRNPARGMSSILGGLAKTIYDPAGSIANAKSAGAIKQYNPTTTDVHNISGAASKLAQMIFRHTGTEAIYDMQRAWGYETGKLYADMALRTGDEKFLNEMGPANWRTMNHDEVVETTAAKVARLTGASDFTELPGWLQQHSGNAVANGPLAFGRWGVGQFNHFRRFVLKPLSEGNVIPLLASVGVGAATKTGWDELNKELFAGKPKEMTPMEWLGLKSEDKGKFLYSMVASMIPAGILSDLAVKAAHQLALGEETSASLATSSPIMESYFKTANGVHNFISALKENPQDLVELLKVFGKDVIMSNVQVANDLAKVTGAKEDKHLREQNMFKQAMGEKLHLGDVIPDKYSPEARFKAADTEERARELAKELKEKPSLPNTSTKPTLKEAAEQQFMQQIGGPRLVEDINSAKIRQLQLNKLKESLVKGLPPKDLEQKQRYINFLSTARAAQ